jgi:hypothetical protein
LNQRPNIIKTTNANLRPIAFVLLALVGHALFLNYTHHHLGKAHLLSSSTTSVSADHHSPEQHLPQSGHDNHCVTCQLQRDFASPLASSVVISCPTPELAGWEAFLCQYYSTEHFALPSGRAPPLA